MNWYRKVSPRNKVPFKVPKLICSLGVVLSLPELEKKNLGILFFSFFFSLPWVILKEAGKHVATRWSLRSLPTPVILCYDSIFTFGLKGSNHWSSTFSKRAVWQALLSTAVTYSSMLYRDIFSRKTLRYQKADLPISSKILSWSPNKNTGRAFL